MQRHLTITKDGSHTISIPEMNVSYHSHHGAIQESQHVFIDAGLKYYHSLHSGKAIRIFEMGFGTGLNALLTFIAVSELDIPAEYTALELFPLEKEKIDALNYDKQVNVINAPDIFQQMHAAAWNRKVNISTGFSIGKINADLVHWKPAQGYDLIYYDAFAPSAQPQLWSADIFIKLYSMLSTGGILVTYCSKGDVRRAMQSAGFLVTKLPGPPGKREMVRAVKP
jgi:tRNA U34 5-methylaminomethyl-2-thiouridine-forming methyltransferase MnmC